MSKFGVILANGFFSSLIATTQTLARERIERWTDADGRVNFRNIQIPDQPSISEAFAVAEASSASAEDDGSVERAPRDRTREDSENADFLARCRAALRAAERSSRANDPEPSGEEPAVTDANFSELASRQRMDLRRQLKRQERRLGEIDRELANAREKKQVAMEAARRSFGASVQAADYASPEEEKLLEERKDVEKRVAGIRDEYAKLAAEATKRHGRKPSWLLPLD